MIPVCFLEVVVVCGAYYELSRAVDDVLNGNGASCHNHGLYANGRCVCDLGYSGAFCEMIARSSSSTQLLNDPCNYGGTLNSTGGCDCRSGYSGDKCETFSCTSDADCSNGGKCAQISGSSYCLCPLGFSGADCKVDSCNVTSNPGNNGNVTCNMGGECLLMAPDTNHSYYRHYCSCRTGFSGDKCENFECYGDTTCYNDGVCEKTNGAVGTYCSCLPGFSGADCYVNSCDMQLIDGTSNLKYCSNGGTCQTKVPGSGEKYYVSWCECRDNFSGEFCETYKCLAANGTDLCPTIESQKLTCTDNNGVQSCTTCPDYLGGLDCSLPLCGYDSTVTPVEVCSGQGTCKRSSTDYSVCECSSGYMGVNCSSPACTNNTTCGTHGSCILSSNSNFGVCECQKGYEGDLCDKCEPLLTEHEYYTLEKDENDVYKITNTSTVCASPACIFDGTVCNNGGECVFNRGWHCECGPGFFQTFSGSCVPIGGNCGDTANLCGGRGTCIFSPDTTNNVASWSCACETGTKFDSLTGACLPDSCFSSEIVGTEACSGRGICLWNGICMCEDKFSGDQCADCAAKYMRGNDTYKDHCFPNLCDYNGLTCNGTGTCEFDDERLVYECRCRTGYSGIDCSSCADGYRMGENRFAGICVRDFCIGSPPCGGNGDCISSNIDGSYSCNCSIGYSGVNCSDCTAGYRLGEGRFLNRCVRDLCVGDPACDGNGTCVSSPLNGTYSCECNPGYTGVDCSGCSAGYRMGDDPFANRCVRDFCIDDPSCSNHGDCKFSQVDGTYSCECNPGYMGTLCTDCMLGFREYGVSSEAVCVADYCRGDDECGGKGKCEYSKYQRSYVCTCSAGYFLEHNSKECMLCTIPNCAVCDTEKICNTCVAGYYPDENGTCSICNAACTTCSGPTEKDCITCAQGTIRGNQTEMAGNCLPECTVGKDDCATCGAVIDGGRYCSRCSDDMYPLEGSCTSLGRAASPCLRVLEGACTKCSEDYFLYMGGCYSSSRLPGSSVCQQTTGNGSCQLCSSGFFSINNDCFSCPDNCEVCDLRGSCSTCKLGFFQDNGSCVGCHPSCLGCFGPRSDQCNACRLGYFNQLGYNGQPSNTCRPCDDTEVIMGLSGKKGCTLCHPIFRNGSAELFCLESKAGLSLGAIIGIVVVVLAIIGGIVGFCVYWFRFRNKGSIRRKSSFSSRRIRMGDSVDYVSFMTADESGTFI
ncbi:High cysteine membrane protein [Giardia muris]|uniref:High cysteine membrane protein n=1 Tax=Giardia muris TaxID=5742 RepID=A0A4Z1SXY2_GIAMU|nr:High cysteine membrane protein [Giardia muris]|eukprot:TNJ28378.1 High cysteine membrane protein [Giardia muris]